MRSLSRVKRISRRRVKISKKSNIIVEKKKVSGGGSATNNDITYAKNKLNSLFEVIKTEIESLQDREGETPPILVKSNKNKFFINPLYLKSADNDDDLQNKLKNLLSIYQLNWV